MNVGDIVLLGLRDYQDEKADVILKYNADEARALKQYKELPENIRVNDADAMLEEDGADDGLVDFGGERDRQQHGSSDQSRSEEPMRLIGSECRCVACMQIGAMTSLALGRATTRATMPAKTAWTSTTSSARSCNRRDASYRLVYPAVRRSSPNRDPFGNRPATGSTSTSSTTGGRCYDSRSRSTRPC